jgi:hypothetical protein
VKPFSVIRVWWRCGMSAALLVVCPFASAQDPTPHSFRELETKYIFGFALIAGHAGGNANFLDLTNFSRCCGPCSYSDIHG